MANTGVPFSLPYPVDADAPNGPLQLHDLAVALAPFLDAGSGQTYRKSNSAQQNHSNTSFAALGTQDKVTGLVVPAGGILEVSFRALVGWSQVTSPDVASTIRTLTAALFIGANPIGTGGNQLKAASSSSYGTPAVAEFTTQAIADGAGGVANWGFLTLGQNRTGGAGTDPSVVTTGEVINTNDFVAVQGLSAGTYDVEVRYKAIDAARKIEAKSRELVARVIAPIAQ